MKYRVAFKNGMVATIQAEGVSATARNHIVFLKGQEAAPEVYVDSYNVLFVAPEHESFVERPAVKSIPDESK